MRAGNAGFIEGGGWAKGFPQLSEMKITVGVLYRTIKQDYKTIKMLKAFSSSPPKMLKHTHFITKLNISVKHRNIGIYYFD